MYNCSSDDGYCNRKSKIVNTCAGYRAYTRIVRRREWDSNPRWLSPNMFSRHAPSAARPSLHGNLTFVRGGSDFTIYGCHAERQRSISMIISETLRYRSHRPDILREGDTKFIITPNGQTRRHHHWRGNCRAHRRHPPRRAWTETPHPRSGRSHWWSPCGLG